MPLRAALSTLALAAAVAAPFTDPLPPRPVPRPVSQGEPLEDYEFLSCWGCHETITDEWASSRHAHAWVDARYQSEIAEKRRPETCHGCHIPERLQSTDLARKPKPRDEELERLHFGISCKSCHLAPDGAMLGPIDDPVPTDAHASRFSEGFTEAGSNALCIACHRTTVGPVIGVAVDFVVTDQAARGKSCVGCHMEAVERPVATDDDDAPTPARAGRRHTLLGPRDPAFLATAFGISVAREGDAVVVRLANEAAHGIPGLLDRELDFAATLEGGAVTARTRVDATEPLAVDATRELRLVGPGQRVRLAGTHRAAALPEPVTFLELELDVAE